MLYDIFRIDYTDADGCWTVVLSVTPKFGQAPAAAAQDLVRLVQGPASITINEPPLHLGKTDNPDLYERVGPV